jgi:hypothetical protein
LLTPNQKHQRAALSVEFVEMIDGDINVLKRIVIGDESWCFMYNSETKRKLRAQMVKMQKSHVKTMLTSFLYAKGIIHHEFVLEKQTVKYKFYTEVIKTLIAPVHRVRPEFQESGSRYLLHENAAAHSLGVVSEFLAKYGIPVLSHPPYYPDLVLAVFLHFLN